MVQRCNNFTFSLFDILLIDLFLFNSGSSELKMKQLQLDCEFKNAERGGFPQGLNPRLAVSCNNHYCNIIVAIRLKCFQYHPQLKNFLATAQTFVAKFQWCEMYFLVTVHHSLSTKTLSCTWRKVSCEYCFLFSIIMSPCQLKKYSCKFVLSNIYFISFF